jgi:ABC-type spermidine/putrescine transport system permease subunit I
VAAFGGGRVRVMADMAYEESSALVGWQLGAAALVVLLVSAAILLRLLFAGLRRADRGAPARPMP